MVNFWSNGDFRWQPELRVAVATHDTALDYTGDVAVKVPEPGLVGPLGSGLVGMMTWRRRAARQR